MPMKRVTGAGLREGERATGVGRWSMLLALSLVLCAGAAQAQNQAAGRVEFARGVGYAQSPGQNARILGKGWSSGGRHAEHLAGRLGHHPDAGRHPHDAAPGHRHGDRGYRFRRMRPTTTCCCRCSPAACARSPA
jgi:hypothetical protein